MARKRKRDEISERLEGLAEVAAGFEHWKPAGEVLTRVRSLPTQFVQVDFASRVGGWPMQRFALVHGPSNHGKTAFSIGLGASFLEGGHFFGLIDAEHTTPEDWLIKLMGQWVALPGFVAMRPESYEQAVDGVRGMLAAISKAREAGKLAPGTSALIVVDSIRKLVPKGLLAKILKGKDGIDGAKGRAAQMKAALNAQWLDELTPALYQSGAAMVFIARESENPDAGTFDQDFKIGGGKALQFESSLSARVTRAAWVKDGSGDDARVVGERHRVRIWKTKVGPKDDKCSDAFFHTSNGTLTPEGFDRARDVLELARDFGVVTVDKGHSYQWASAGEVLARGESATIRKLSDDPKTLAAIEAEVRGQFDARHERRPAAEVAP